MDVPTRKTHEFDPVNFFEQFLLRHLKFERISRFAARTEILSDQARLGHIPRTRNKVTLERVDE